MSYSDPARGVPIQITADKATETFVLDHAFRMVARGIGNFTCSLPSGLYKFKFRSGLAIEEMYREIPPDGPRPLLITAPALASSSAVPLRNTRQVSYDQLGEAERISSGPATKLGDGSHLLLFVRCEATDPLPPHTAEGLTLHRLDGTLVTDVAKVAPSSPADSSGLLVEVDPGPYRLRVACERGPLEQIVISSAGWQTQVFLLRETTTGESAISLATASVLMSRGAFHADDEMLRLADAARIALGGKRVTMARQLLEHLLVGKFENPMLGIYAGHALRATDDDSLLQRLIPQLDAMIPDHPDVMALSLSFAATDSMPINIPPMLRSSWAAIIDATLDGRVQLVPGSLVARIPSALLDDTPWLIWPEPALLPLYDAPRPTTQQLLGIQQILAEAKTDDLPESLDLSESEDALYYYLSRRNRIQKRAKSAMIAPLDAHGLAKAFGTTLPDVQTTVDGLASKLLSVGKKFEW